MIPVRDALVDLDSIPGEEISFGIGDPRWVMKTQADLYSDITTAIIREYSTNAYDAHVMANNPDPIQVTLPSWSNPFFVVEDKGVGMDLDIFRKVYTQFGISDKRESNTTNGMLGYGSKSGIAYTTQFSVTSVKNGVKTYGIIKRKPDWEIVLKVVSTVKTDEPNGTRIEIPVHNSDEFVHKANQFYKYWLPGRVLVNGKEPEHAVGQEISEGFYRSADGHSCVVMGNVAYRINNPSALFQGSKITPLNFVAYVDTVDGGAQAAVEFTPSREDLKYTDHTKNTLATVVKKFSDNILKKVQDEIDQAKSHSEAFVAWHSWGGILGNQSIGYLKYKGEVLKEDFDITGKRWRTGAYRYTVDSIAKYDVITARKTVFVTDFNLNLASHHKRAVKDYAKSKGWSYSYVVFTPLSDKEIDCKWLDRSQFVTYDVVKASIPKKVKTPGTAYNAGRVAGSWDYIDSTTYYTEKPVPVVKNKGELFYITVQEDKSVDARGVFRLVGDHDSFAIIVPQNRLAKFRRENPNVKHFISHFSKKVIKDPNSLLDNKMRLARSIEYSEKSWLRKLANFKINDPIFKELNDAIAHNESTVNSAYEHNANLARALHVSLAPVNATVQKKRFTNQYPLLEYLTYMSKASQAAEYINAMYEYNRKKDGK